MRCCAFPAFPLPRKTPSKINLCEVLSQRARTSEPAAHLARTWLRAPCPFLPGEGISPRASAVGVPFELSEDEELRDLEASARYYQDQHGAHIRSTFVQTVNEVAS